MLNLLVFIRSSELDMPAGLKLILTMPCGLFQLKRTSAWRKILTPGLQNANTTFVPLSKQAVAILTELQTWAGKMV